MMWKIHIFNIEENKEVSSTDWMPSEEVEAVLPVLNKPSMFGLPPYKTLLEPEDVSTPLN